MSSNFHTCSVHQVFVKQTETGNIFYEEHHKFAYQSLKRM